MGEVECYLPQEDFLSKLVCFVADAASVNFGDISGALTAIAQLSGMSLRCNHRLKLAMKDAYQGEQELNTGKTWTLHQTVATSLGLVAQRFTKVSGTMFQAHVLTALKNLRNLLNSVLFAENVEENGSGKDVLVTKETYPKTCGFCKKMVEARLCCYR